MFDVIDLRGNLLYRTMETPAAYLVEIKCANLMKLGVSVTSGAYPRAVMGQRERGLQGCYVPESQEPRNQPGSLISKEGPSWQARLAGVLATASSKFEMAERKNSKPSWCF